MKTKFRNVKRIPTVEEERAFFKLPNWVKRIKDREKRNLVEQEYYVNPSLAVRFNEECETAADIRDLRKILVTIPHATPLAETEGYKIIDNLII
jgi:hypothetical protein